MKPEDLHYGLCHEPPPQTEPEEAMTYISACPSCVEHVKRIAELEAQLAEARLSNQAGQIREGALSQEVERLRGKLVATAHDLAEQRRETQAALGRADEAQAEVERLRGMWEEKSLAHANAHAARRNAEAKLGVVLGIAALAAAKEKP